ncbi:vacuolar protein-sorting-associated protein 25 isoform X2 [Ischnura elegans]|uniref:vacuolar protein-sorting-associated protein 25 isoform X2 n=1 Tax=Ischnura elegans TaxID=197161 RepID=UPI001ED8B947|nr:vacuolar protein-sorting-associated protein 25 isoform X2 [Ischnura elegans]
MAETEWPWQYDFPPFFTIQPHLETQNKQISAWQSLILCFFKNNKSYILDIREAQNSPLFNNSKINRKLPQDGILKILEHLHKSGHAEPCDKSKNRWFIYWHTLDEWASMIYDWAQGNGMINTVCTLYELVSGDNTVNEEFYGLDMGILMKALRTLEMQKKAEIIMFDDNEGVKFL